MNLRTAFAAAVVALVAVAATGCGHLMMMMHGRTVARPAVTEFGPGPRASAARQFSATLQPDQPLRPRRMQTVRVAIVDADGRPVDDATIQIDGSMPQHGHGLPTRRRGGGRVRPSGQQRRAARAMIDVVKGPLVSDQIKPLADAGCHPVQALMPLHVIYSTTNERRQAAVAGVKP